MQRGINTMKAEGIERVFRIFVGTGLVTLETPLTSGTCPLCHPELFREGSIPVYV